ncbi:N-acetylneuraminate synthase family protein [Candidatus Kaiserbacteria bacterium]|nr:N-acetylneuraminate synthase family protein [Candidatus Kaiserbacteria bacterium]
MIDPQNKIFEDLFVMEIANNHWGDVSRGKKIIEEYGKLIKKYDIKAAMKFQFRDPETFIHKDFLNLDTDGETEDVPGTNTRYVKKTIATALTKEQFKELLDYSKEWGFMTMTTPFDEKSVDLAVDLGVEIMKVGSGTAISWPLVEKIAAVGKPTIISNGGTRIEDLDRVIQYFEDKNVPLAVNHCVSLYPSEDNDLELHQIDFLRKRYPKHVIGFSTHEYNDWSCSLMMAYAKGARTFERHIDIEDGGIKVSPYCSLPHQVEQWFIAYKKAKEMLGSEVLDQRILTDKEEVYVRSVCRGAYAKKDLPEGHVINRDSLDNDFYLAIPLQEGQLSERELEKETVLSKPIKKDEPIS